jgi:hypothetical protein
MSSINFPDRDSTSTMDANLYRLWVQANTSAGYRYSVEARPGSQSRQGKVATVSVVWTNYGSAAATEQWAPGYKRWPATTATARAYIRLPRLTYHATRRSQQTVNDCRMPARAPYGPEPAKIRTYCGYFFSP